jgi:hypothetical protein
MKKVLLIGFALVFAVATQAQEVRKQTGGEKNLEFLFSPLGGNPVSISGIKYRKFTSATEALRATVFLGFNSSTDKFLAENEDQTELKDTESNWDVSVAVGKEWHFAGTDNLSPYVGAEVLVGYGQDRTKMEMLDADEDIQDVTTTQGMFMAGLNALAGCDVYVADNFYFGGELGFGLLFTSEGNEKTESSVEGSDTIETPGGSSFGIGPNVVGQIRAGFLFGGQ